MKCIQIISDLKKLGFLCLVLIFITSLVSCNGDSGSSTTTSNASISGVVADGYVKNAQVFVYSDAGMTNQIGSGTTDDNGEFSITLNVSSIPDTVYIKSVGGTVIDTGMPAPTMLFVGSNDLGTFNVTPLTDSLYKYTTSKGSMSSAADYMKNKLGMDDTSLLWGDPVANSDLQDELYKVLSSGTQSGTLPDGSYKAVVIYLEEDNIGDAYTGINDIITNNKLEMSITISNGAVTGSISGSNNIVTGKVQGCSILLNILDDQYNPTQLTRVAGSIGLLGSVAGVYTNFDSTPPTLTKGVFVASFIPATGLDQSGVNTVVQNIFIGKRHAIYRDIFGDDSGLVWGDITITDIDFTNSTVTASDMTVYVDAGSSSNSNPTSVQLTYDPNNPGQLINNSDGLPANIAILQFATKDGNNKVFFIQPIGIRRGIYLVVDTTNSDAATNIGDAYLSKAESMAPSLDANTTYEVSVAVAHPGLINQQRDTSNMFFTGESFTTPSDITSAAYNSSGGILKAFNGSMIAFLRDGDDDGLGDGFDSSDDNLDDNNIPQHDFLRLVELYETGAMQGEEMMGGSVKDPFTGASTPMKKFPATFVGFLKKQGETAPTFSGTLNFLARTLYTTDADAYLNAYISGTITISGNSATLSWALPSGDSGTATLTANTTGGVYHLYGALGDEYIDIYWPIGGQKAVYVQSDSSDGNGTINEVGEAYLTY